MNESTWNLGSEQSFQGSLYDAQNAKGIPSDDKALLDQLFESVLDYRRSSQFLELLRFVAQFRSLAPYNALLVRLQRPGARYVTSAREWLFRYGRRIKPGANPLIILRTFGPVDYVFDVADTEPAGNFLVQPDLPPEVERPFEPGSGAVGEELERTISNARRDGIRIEVQRTGSQAAGQIATVTGPPLFFPTPARRRPELPAPEPVQIRYELLISEHLSREARYVTLVHELAHLYCGHLGSPNVKWWPTRLGLDHAAREFEAESTAFLVCARLGIDNPSARYLSGYVSPSGEIPRISVETVFKAAGLIERMGRETLRPRKKDE